MKIIQQNTQKLRIKPKNFFVFQVSRENRNALLDDIVSCLLQSSEQYKR